MSWEKVVRALDSAGYAFVSSEEWAINRQRPEIWNDFLASWDRLDLDRYMKSGDTYRKRRFCKYLVDASTMSFKELDDFVFIQSAALNAYAGDLRRNFAPIEPSIRQHRLLREIIRQCLTALRCVAPESRFWRVYVHQVRIECDVTVAGKPTPEGLHQDGHDFISLHLIGRTRIEGGTSTIADRDRRSLTTVTLEHRMDGFLIDDRKVMHGVSPITPATAEPGHRDMLIIDYNREG